MAFKHASELALLWLSLSGLSHGFWRMSCSLAQTSRIDPIINPGGLSAHAHKIVGPNIVYMNSTYDDLNAAPCTSCEIQADKSAYWTPQLYYQHANGAFEEVPNAGTVVYYLGRGDNRSSIVPFPKGFRMVSGNPATRSYDNSTRVYGPNNSGRLLADRVSFNCLNSEHGNPETPGFPTIDCPSGLRAQMQFQSCWDGVNLYKPDQSHVAYLSSIDNGVCPPTHPVPLPHLFFEVLYDTNAYKQDGGRLVLSQGDSTGYGFHGDFLNGWDMDVQTAAMNDCLNTDNQGQISACPHLVKSQIPNYASKCPEAKPIVNEPVKGTIQKLPGCIKVTDGPAAASLSDMNCPAGYPQPSINPPFNPARNASSTFGVIEGGWQDVGCASEGTSGRALTAASWASDNMTNEACREFCASKRQPLAGTEYGRECYCGANLQAGSELGIDCSQNSMPCAGNQTEYCGGPNLLHIWNSTSPLGRTPLTRGTKVGGYIYVGCATESKSGRVLSGASFTNSTGMTNELCGAFCKAKGFSLFGTEWSSECYCDNSLAQSSTLPADGCTMGCAGDASADSPWAKYTNICGGSSRLSLFNITQG